MAENTNIEWCDSTWNGWIGCTKVSREESGGGGCDHCYAEVSTPARTMKIGWGAGQPRHRTAPATWNMPYQWNDQPFCECMDCGWRGESRKAKVVKNPAGFHPPIEQALICPGCGKVATLKAARRRVFCMSLADVFDNEVDPAWRADLFFLIEQTPNLDWLLLTKRIGNVERMIAEASEYLARVHKPLAWPLPNVWLGATIVNRDEMLRDGPKLMAVPARVRFWSAEPLLGDLGEIPLELMPDLGIAGGESGSNARPMHPDWPRNMRDQFLAAGRAFLFKQWGEWLPISAQSDEFNRSLYRSNRTAKPHEDQGHLDDCYGRTCTVEQCVIQADGSVVEALAPMAFRQGAGSMLTFRVGKKAAGRLLDGRTWDGFPT